MSKAVDHDRAALDFVNRCLAGERPTVEDIVALCSTVREGLHLDYKGKDWPFPTPEKLKREKAGEPVRFDRKLRKWMAGFANVGSGALILGVTETKDPATQEETWSVDPITQWDKRRAERLLQEYIANGKPYVPPHRVHVIEHPGGGVLVVVAVERASVLIPCIESEERWLHYLRIGDGTYAAPSYLVEDMQLGKHRRSLLTLRGECSLGGTAFYEFEAPLLMTLGNESLVHLQHVRAGIVYYSHHRNGSTNMTAALASAILDGGSADSGFIHHRRLTCGRNTELIAPFEEVPVTSGPGIRIPEHSRGFAWCAAVYVTGIGQPPTWFQVAMSMLPWIKQVHPLPLEIRRCEGSERPLVGYYKNMSQIPGQPEWRPTLEKRQ